MKNAFEKFRFQLPDELIARYPVEKRENSRLLIVRNNGKLENDFFHNIDRYFEKDDILIINETRVSKRKIELKRKSGAILETLFLKPEMATTSNEKPENERYAVWICLMKNSRKVKYGEVLYLSQGYTFTFLGRSEYSDGAVRIAIKRNDQYLKSQDQAEEFFEQHGSMPLPPYLKRKSEQQDNIRYQSIFARKTGSVAAPTASLHFTEEIKGKLIRKGVKIASINLEIGFGTFSPLKEENLRTSRLHEENYTIPEETARLMNQYFENKMADKLRLTALGTTTLRAIESNYRQFQKIEAGRFSTRLFLRPPETILSADRLITNFHLPESSLLMLVSAFSSREKVLSAYDFAIENCYRFFSFGDAMLIENEPDNA